MLKISAENKKSYPLCKEFKDLQRQTGAKLSVSVGRVLDWGSKGLRLTAGVVTVLCP